MKEKNKQYKVNIIGNKDARLVLLCGVVFIGLTLFAWMKSPDAYSESERRSLAQAPKISAMQLTSGKYMSEFESYSLDQFPLRDGLRSVKAVASKYLFGQRDNHGLYREGAYISKLEYPLNNAKVALNEKKLAELVDTYLKGTECKVYLSIIPDKNYFLAPPGGYPTVDYEELMQGILEKVPYDEYIDIFDMLSLEDYYYTDQHWRQERLLDVAEKIGVTMGQGQLPGDQLQNIYGGLQEQELKVPFYGAYVGQLALPARSDQIHYLTGEALENCQVMSYNTGVPTEAFMYDMVKAQGRDPYEMYLGGSDPLIEINNPNPLLDRELVVFRDSFGSSLIPLLAPIYQKITVVDLRYMRSNLLGEYIQFEGQDILFLYSTLVFNNNISM